MFVRHRFKVATIWITSGIVAVLLGQDRRAEIAPGNASIHEEHLRADLSFIASDLLQGRMTGTTGNQIAAEFIRGRFERLGLKPIGPDGSYFQSYKLMTATLGTQNTLEVQGAGKVVPTKVREDFFPQPFSASAHNDGPLVFAGFGIVAPQRGYDDYRGTDVRGRVVLVLDHEPGEQDPGSPLNGLVDAEAAAPLRKTLAAQDRGAVAILFVRDVHNHSAAAGLPLASEAAGIWPQVPPRIQRYTLATWADRVRIPAMEISSDLASTLLRGTGKSLNDLSRESESTTGRTPLAIPNVRVDVSALVTRTLVADQNVVAAIDGGDPRLRDEWVIIGAHLDHDGADGTRVFNGADDNGSGTVAVLEIAEAYAEAASAGQRPRRSVLFALWNSEERGLLGSRAYTEQPLVPLDRTIGVINIDMIGRNEEIPSDGGARFQGLPAQTSQSNRNAVNVLGYSYAAELSDEVVRANAAFGLEVKQRYDNVAATLLSRSDQWPFLQRGVPAIWVFSGLHPDYHTPADRLEKINYPKMTRIVRLVHQTSWALAQRDGRPKLTQPVN
jgi:Peptidase family M28